VDEDHKLPLIFENIYSKVRQVQTESNFDMAFEKETTKTYIGMPNNFFSNSSAI
jgi:hypothetical protein